MCELEMLSTSQIIHLWELWNPTFWSVVSFFFFPGLFSTLSCRHFRREECHVRAKRPGMRPRPRQGSSGWSLSSCCWTCSASPSSSLCCRPSWTTTRPPGWVVLSGSIFLALLSVCSAALRVVCACPDRVLCDRMPPISHCRAPWTSSERRSGFPWKRSTTASCLEVQYSNQQARRLFFSRVGSGLR